MEALVEYVSEKTRLPLPAAEIVASTTLDYLTPHFSPLLKNSIEVLLHHPNLSDVEKDLLIASRVLFPTDAPFENEPPKFND